MSETRRPTNIKRAARELQAQNPGMSYTEARAKVVAAAATTTPTCVSCGHSTLHDTAGIGVCRTPDCGCDGPVNGAAADFTTPDPFDGLVTWTTVAVSASHVSESEWNTLTAGPNSNWVFRSMPDPDGNGTVHSVMVRSYSEDLHCEDEGPTQVSEQFPTLLRVLRWAADNGAGWVYLDIDAEVVDALTQTAEDNDEDDFMNNDEDDFMNMDPATVTEDQASTMLSVYRSQFGWAGTYFTRMDAEIHRPLTDDEWNAVQNSYYWRKGLSDRLTEEGWGPVTDAVLDVIGADLEDGDDETTPLSKDESAALAAFHTFQTRFGWAGSMFMRGDAESVAQRPLTDEEWEAVQDNYYWNRAVADRMAEQGNDLVDSALTEVGILEAEDEDDE